MTLLGTIVSGSTINRHRESNYMWTACVDCGETRWVKCAKRSKQVRNARCRRCAGICSAKSRRKEAYHRGAGNSAWKGGRLVASNNYIYVWLEESSPYFPMATHNGYVMEHRLIIAQSIGRCLLRTEHVHHKNGMKDDNRIENLQLVSQADHHTFTKMCAHCDLRKEIRMLRWQIKEQSDQIRHLTSQLMGVTP
jgi:hypothetical protein